MKLDFDIFKDGRVGGYKVIGMRYNYKDIYSLIGKYNAYTVEITESDAKTVYFDTSSDYYHSDLDTYYNMGDGSRFYNNISSYTYTTPGIYQIITSARIDRTVGNNPKLIAVNGIRRDSISLDNAFNNYGTMKEFKPINVSTKRVTSMNRTFYNCVSGVSNQFDLLDLSNWITTNVTDMSEMFRIDLDMFNYDSKFHTIDMSGWSTSNVTNMSAMFYNNDTLREILGIGDWDTSNVTDMNHMFYGCDYLHLPKAISNWDTSKVQSFKNMFYNMRLLGRNDYVGDYTIDFSSWDTSNVTDMSGMFYGCKYLTTLDIPWAVNNVTNISSMFEGCQALISLDLSSWDVSNVTDMSYMFYNCEALISLDLSTWDTSKVTNMLYMLHSCKNLRELRLYNCSISTIKSIINSSGFPTNLIDGETRTIYCNKAYEGQLTEPVNWSFSYID